MSRQSGGTARLDKATKAFYAALPPYNVKADGKTITDAAITAGQNQLSSPGTPFVASDQGKLCVVVGAGTPVSGTLSAATTTGAITSLAVNALSQGILPGGVVVDDGAGHVQSFVTSGALAGATSVPFIGPVVGATSSALATGAAITSIPVAALNFALPSGSVALVYIDSAGVHHTQTFSTTGAAVGATSIPVTSVTPNYAYPAGTIIFGNPLSATPTFNFPSGSTIRTNVPALSTSIQTVSGGVASLAAAAGTTVSGAECFYATDDYGGLNSCKQAAEAVNGTVILPEGDMGLSAALVSSVALEICGQGVKELYGATSTHNSGNWPSVAPYLKGSVLVQCAPNADIVQYTAQGVSQNLRGVGLRFAGKWQNTGHGLNCNSVGRFFGQVGGQLQDVKVYGVDGNHYGFLIDAAELMRWTGLRSYGGGGLWYRTNGSTGGRPGNTTVSDFYACLFIAGIAQASLFDSAASTFGFDYCSFSEFETAVRIPLPALANTTPPINGGAQNLIQTFNSVLMTLMGFVTIGMESDATGQLLTWPNGAGCFRLSDPQNASAAQIAQAKPTGAPVNGTGYQNLYGREMWVNQEFVLAPAATATASTTTTATLSFGSTNIPVVSSAGFAVGQGVQIDTGASMEFGIVSAVPDGTHVTVATSGGLAIENSHASGVTVAAGAAVVRAQTNATNSWPGARREAQFASAIGDSPRQVALGLVLVPSWWYRLDWANGTRMNTNFVSFPS